MRQVPKDKGERMKGKLKRLLVATPLLTLILLIPPAFGVLTNPVTTPAFFLCFDQNNPEAIVRLFWVGAPPPPATQACPSASPVSTGLTSWFYCVSPCSTGSSTPSVFSGAGFPFPQPTSPFLPIPTAPNSCTSGDIEYFGNSIAPPDPQAGGITLVGSGTTGSSSSVDNMWTINSISTGCPASPAIPIPITTRYQFFIGGGVQNRFKVTRQFSFGSTPFLTTEHGLLPYIPRLYPRTSFYQILYFDNTNSLVTKNVGNCEFGGDTPSSTSTFPIVNTYCRVADWKGDFFVIFSPSTGVGVIVEHSSSMQCVGSTCTSLAVNLWLDQDGGSWSDNTSVLLAQPAGGFQGTVTEEETLCFFNSVTFNNPIASLLSGSLPTGC